ncbi:MAG: ATP-binding protein [Massilia sp.]
MIDQVHWYLILTGLTIGSVLAALWYQARKASRLNLALIRLNEQLGFDTPVFLVQAWQLLAQSGLRGMAWRLDWFGVPRDGQHGQRTGRCSERSLDAGEMRLHLSFFRHEGRGERRYFEETLIETFMLLLRMDMLIKSSSTDAALSHMARMNLFLQHDMKNIAQFIQLMSDQLATVAPGREHKVLDYLRLASPLIRHRADRIVRALTVGALAAEQRAPVALRPLLAQVCGLYGLRYQLDGDAEVAFGADALETVLDNIVKNYHDLAARAGAVAPMLELAISEQAAEVEITLRAPGAPLPPALERLFEPFWSSSPEGLGIGLYQARHVMEAQGGSLFVTQDQDKTVCFHLLCPKIARQNPLPRPL